MIVMKMFPALHRAEPLRNIKLSLSMVSLKTANEPKESFKFEEIEIKAEPAIWSNDNRVRKKKRKENF